METEKDHGLECVSSWCEKLSSTIGQLNESITALEERLSTILPSNPNPPVPGTEEAAEELPPLVAILFAFDRDLNNIQRRIGDLYERVRL